MINLNDDKFTAGASGPIFNDGNAGIAENVTISVERKKPEDKETAPDYKLVFKGENGGTCNTAFWHITQDTQFKTVDQQTEAMGKVCKHLLHAIYGADYEIPSFQSAKDMLDGTMKLVNDGVKAGPLFRIWANYGTPKSVKKYIQPRTWVPFMEPMAVALEDTRLVKGNYDAMERLQEDAAPVGGGAIAGNDDDWD